MRQRREVVLASLSPRPHDKVRRLVQSVRRRVQREVRELQHHRFDGCLHVDKGRPELLDAIVERLRLCPQLLQPRRVAATAARGRHQLAELAAQLVVGGAKVITLRYGDAALLVQPQQRSQIGLFATARKGRGHLVGRSADVVNVQHDCRRSFAWN